MHAVSVTDQKAPEAPAIVPDHEFAPLVLRREDDHERREHPRSLLGVPVFREEVARFVDEQLVQLRVNRAVYAQGGRRVGDDAFERAAPARVVGVDTRRRNLATPADLRVHDRLGAATVGGGARHPRERVRLRVQDRERESADAVHGDAHHRQFDSSRTSEVAGTLQSGQGAGEEAMSAEAGMVREISTRGTA